MVSSSSGKPGAASNMLVRGANSLTGSTAPLIVIDGFPLFEVSTTGGGIDAMDVGMSSLSMVNTDDIASIEVLKDASATAIYGNRGANGVIIITTKKGKEPGGKIQYNTYLGIQEMSRRYDMMDFAQYADYQATVNTSNELFYDKANGVKRTLGQHLRMAGEKAERKDGETARKCGEADPGHVDQRPQAEDTDLCQGMPG